MQLAFNIASNLFKRNILFMWLKHKNSIKKGQSNLMNKSNGQIKNNYFEL